MHIGARTDTGHAPSLAYANGIAVYVGAHTLKFVVAVIVETVHELSL
jgi:hypothetical protein